MLIAVCLGFGLAGAESAHAQVRSLRAVTHAGKRYVTLKDLASMYGLPLSEPGGKTLLVRGQYIVLQFTKNGREAIVNGSKVWLHAPVVQVRGSWSISDADARFVVDPMVRPSAYLGARGTRTVVLDPGHGGKDPGAIGRGGLLEKDVALDLALRTAAHLRANGIRVILTRDTDRFWELKDRPFLAARGGGDLFVSIHLNATGTRSVQGIETFAIAAEHYPPTSDPRLKGRYPAVPNNRFNHSSTILGHQLQRSMVGITRAEDRGLKRARFHVLKNSAMPAALVECGFLSNPQEEQKLATPSYRETVAQGLAQGILNYIALVNRAKVELGAPLLQPSVPAMAGPAAPSPAAAPIPMAARAWGPAAAPPPLVAHPVAVAPGPAPAAPAAPAVAAVPPVAMVRPVPAPAVQPPPAARRPVPAPAFLPLPANAPPPSSLLNPSLGSH